MGNKKGGKGGDKKERKKSVSHANQLGKVFENGKKKNRDCPKCGKGVTMAQHKDRVHCGKCGYTEFNK